MSKLYLRADTDMIKTVHTARGNKRIDASVGYDESRYDKKIKLEVTRDEEKLNLYVTDSNRTLLFCTGTIKDGITVCQPYNYAGPYPKLDMKMPKQML